jgi:GNAT superfamily N-acetyltransferase
VSDVRRRRPADIPALVDVLREQQATSRYPFRDPLPIPVEQFLHQDDATGAWTAALDGRPVGHVCYTSARTGFPGAVEMNRACARAHACDVDRLAWISALFVGLEARGLGVGRSLLTAAVDDIRRAGLHPCLEVLPVHPAAMTLYISTGWREVMRLRPEWLRVAVGDDGPDVTVMVLTDGDETGRCGY